MEELRTLVQVWKRGGAAACAWQHDWRDGSRQQAYQGQAPTDETFVIIQTFNYNHR